MRLRAKVGPDGVGELTSPLCFLERHAFVQALPTERALFGNAVRDGMRAPAVSTAARFDLVARHGDLYL
jgi:hypothetical protein